MSHPTPGPADEALPEQPLPQQPNPPASQAPDEARSASGFDPAESAEAMTAKATAKAQDGKAKQGGLLAWVKEIVIVIVIALVLSFVLKTFFFRAYFIPSESMQNTLQVDDRIFVNLLVPRPFALSRGDVVVFNDTQGWLPAPPTQPANWFKESLTFVGLMPDESQKHLIKRVIGLPGDRVVCCDANAQITVNGKGLVEPYLYPGSSNTAGPNASFDVTVPPGKLWVMGDNRNRSADSRFHQESASQGFVAEIDVEGTASVIAWPLNRWAMLGNYPDTFRDVPAPSSEPVSSPEPVPSGN